MNRKELFRAFFGCAEMEMTGSAVLVPFAGLEGTAGRRAAARFKGRLFSGFISRGGVTVIRTGIGSALAGDAVLFLGSAGVKNIVFAGTCGGIRDCAVGDLIVPEAAFDGEGFSFYHRKGFSIEGLLAEDRRISADKTLTASLRDFLKEKKTADLKKGDIFTIGSLLAEEKRNLVFLAKRDFKALDMELSAVYAAARTSGVRAAAVLLVSDMPLFSLREEPASRAIYRKRFASLTDLAVEFFSHRTQGVRFTARPGCA